MRKLTHNEVVELNDRVDHLIQDLNNWWEQHGYNTKLVGLERDIANAESMLVKGLDSAEPHHVKNLLESLKGSRHWLRQQLEK